jgi:hypothetical protein
MGVKQRISGGSDTMLEVGMIIYNARYLEYPFLVSRRTNTY